MEEIVPAPNRREYGWRARIGFLRPGVVDETLSKQFYRMAPDGVTLVSVGLGVGALTTGELRAALQRLDDAALEIAKNRPNCIIVGGSHTVVLDGIGSDVALATHLTELTGIPSSTAQTAAVAALRRLGLQNLAVVTPFHDAFNEHLFAFLADSGFVVKSETHLSGEYRQLAEVSLQTSYELGIQAFKQAKSVDGIYFAGAPLPVVDVIEPLEQELGTRVVTSMQATLRMGLDLCGCRDIHVEGYGTLLRV